MIIDYYQTVIFTNYKTNLNYDTITFCSGTQHTDAAHKDSTPTQLNYAAQLISTPTQLSHKAQPHWLVTQDTHPTYTCGERQYSITPKGGCSRKV